MASEVQEQHPVLDGQDSVRPSRRGRPTSVLTDRKIMESTLRCLARDGYERMTVGDVASEAGVTRPTVYRRWPSKADLVTAAIGELVAREDPASGGDAYEGLMAIADALYRALVEEGRLSLFGSIFVEDHHNHSFVQLFQDRVLNPRRGQLERVLSRGQASGELNLDVDVDMVIDFLIGSFVSRYICGKEIPKSWPSRAVNLLWLSIASDSSLGKPGIS
jgi:AcrR family transcriptional regulator